MLPKRLTLIVARAARRRPTLRSPLSLERKDVEQSATQTPLLGSSASLRLCGELRSAHCAALAVLVGAFAFAGCRQDMHDQPKFIPLRPSSFFADGRSERPLIEGTVARGHLNDDTALYTGKGPDGKPLDTFPFPVTKEVVERGQERFNVYCAPCHDRTGSGDGMIVKRGYHNRPRTTSTGCGRLPTATSTT